MVLASFSLPEVFKGVSDIFMTDALDDEAKRFEKDTLVLYQKAESQ